MDLYDGPSFRLLRAYFRKNPRSNVHVFVLSAKYGLIRWETVVRAYDQTLSHARAAQLSAPVRRALANIHHRHEAVFVQMGKSYRTIMFDEEGAFGNIEVAAGGIGKQLGKLRAFLYQTEVD